MRGCTIAKLYDQLPKKNLPLTYPTYWLVASPPAPPSHAVATESNATAAKIMIGGHPVPDGPATMETIYYGNATLFGHGGGNGPWLMSDLESGVYPSSNQNDPNIASLSYPNFATLMLKGYAGNRFALKAGNAQTGPLTITWDGKASERLQPHEEGGRDRAGNWR